MRPSENPLRMMREEHRITQERLQEASGVDQSTISAIELTGRRPGVDTAIRLARGMSRLTRRTVQVEELFPLEELESREESRSPALEK